jgi:hypothetical protein
MVNRKPTVGSFRRVAARNKTNITFLGRWPRLLHGSPWRDEHPRGDAPLRTPQLDALPNGRATAPVALRAQGGHARAPQYIAHAKYILRLTPDL